MKHLALSAFACVALFLGACQSTASGDGTGDAATLTDVTPINTICPMNPKDEVDAAVYREYVGVRVAFCCEHCTEEWDKMTDDAKAAALQKIGVTLPK